MDYAGKSRNFHCSEIFGLAIIRWYQLIKSMEFFVFQLIWKFVFSHYSWRKVWNDVAISIGIYAIIIIIFQLDDAWNRIEWQCLSAWVICIILYLMKNWRAYDLLIWTVTCVKRREHQKNSLYLTGNGSHVKRFHCCSK